MSLDMRILGEFLTPFALSYRSGVIGKGNRLGHQWGLVIEDGYSSFFSPKPSGRA